MMQRTEVEILKSIKMLEHNSLHCHPFDCFGNDNRAKIEIMLDVIKMDRTLAWINSKFLNSIELMQTNPDNKLWRVAMDAKNWLDGEFEIGELLFSERKQIEHNKSI